MSPVHVHLMLNHVPILGAIFGAALLMVALFKKTEPLKKIALAVFVVVAAVSVPVYLTGEPAEDGVKALPGFSKAIVERHENAAGVAFSAVIAAGVAGLLGLVLSRRGRLVPRWVALGALGVALIAAGLTAWTANLGGQIRHTEIRSSSSAVTAPRSHEH